MVAEHEESFKVDCKTPLGGNVVDEKQEDQPHARTVFEAVLDSSLPPEEKAVDRLVDEAFVLVVAGTGDDPLFLFQNWY
jgi:hypothetical protein